MEKIKMKKIKKNLIAAVGFAVLLGGLVLTLASFARSGESFARMEDPVTLVRDVDNPTKQPFQTEVKVTVAAGLSAANGFIDVPTGKLMVIEHVSVQGKAPAGQSVFYSIYNHVAPDLTLRKHIFPATHQVFGITHNYLVSESLRLYADAPSITVYVDRDTITGSASALFVVSGYFVDKQF